MKKVIVSVVILLALIISFQAKAQYSILYEGEGFNAHFTYGKDGNNDEFITMTIVALDDNIHLRKMKNYPFDNRMFK